MTRIDDIKREIERLTFEERAELVAWLHGWEDDAWDERMKRDAAAGRFHRLIDEVEGERQRGQLRGVRERFNGSR